MVRSRVLVVLGVALSVGAFPHMSPDEMWDIDEDCPHQAKAADNVGRRLAEDLNHPPCDPDGVYYCPGGENNNKVHPEYGQKLLPLRYQYANCWENSDIQVPKFYPDRTGNNNPSGRVTTQADLDSCLQPCLDPNLDLLDQRACGANCSNYFSVSARAISRKLFNNLDRKKEMSQHNQLMTAVALMPAKEITFVPRTSPEPFHIPVPQGDEWFDPTGTGEEEITLWRFNDQTSTQAAVNHKTIWFDLEAFYGNAKNLRSMSFQGSFRFVPKSNALADVETTLSTSLKSSLEAVAEGLSGTISIETTQEAANILVRYVVKVHPRKQDDAIAWATNLDQESVPFEDVTNSPIVVVDAPEIISTAVDGCKVQLLPHYDPEVEAEDPGGYLWMKDPKFIPPQYVAGAMIYLRHHNWLCEHIAETQTQADSDKLWQEARRWNIASYQKMFFYEYIPALHGEPAAPYQGYDSEAYPALDPHMQAAAHRYACGSDINDLNLLFDDDWQNIGYLELRNVNSKRLMAKGMKAMIRGMSMQPAHKINGYVIDFMLNNYGPGHKKTPPNYAAKDMQATNIQRGREVGLCGINTIRSHFGKAPYENWLQLLQGHGATVAATEEEERLAVDLEEFYGPDPESGDFYVAGMLEAKKIQGAAVGETWAAVQAENWARIRTADRLYFESPESGFSTEEVAEIKKTSFAEVVKRATGITDLPQQVFALPELAIESTAAPPSSTDLTATEFRKMVPVSEAPDDATGDHLTLAPNVYSENLSPKYNLQWGLIDTDEDGEPDAVDFQVAAATSGWVGLGLVKRGEMAMTATDMVVGRMIDNQLLVDDCFADNIAPPVRDVDRICDDGSKCGEDNLQGKRLTRVNGITYMRFQKPMQTSDIWDRSFDPRSGKVLLVWAYSEQGNNDLIYHGVSRGYSELQLFAQSCDPGEMLSLTTLQCSECAAGYYRAEGMSVVECVRCPNGRFSASGSAECRGCGENSSTPDNFATFRLSGAEWEAFSGATSETTCGCEAGSRSQGGDCVACGEGVDCQGNDVLGLLPGYSSAAGTPSIYKCYLNEERCPGGPLGTCAAGRLGQACAECAEGLAPAGDGTCTNCRGYSYLVLIVCIIVGLVAIVSVYIVAERQITKDAHWRGVVWACVSSVFVTLVQQLSIIQAFSVDWDEPVRGLLEAMLIIQFDTDTAQISCVSTMSPSSRYYTRILLICLGVVLMIPIHVIVSKVYHKASPLERVNVLKGAGGTWLSCFFLTTIFTSIVPFQCFQHPNGESTVFKFPVVNCDFSGSHGLMTGIGIISFLMIPTVFAAFCIYTITQFPTRASAEDKTWIRSHAFLFLRFKPEAYWFPIVMFGRNVVISFMPLLISSWSQLLLAGMITLSYMVVLLVFLPWSKAVGNMLDTGVSATIMILLIFGAIISTRPTDHAATWIVVAVFLQLLVLGLASVAHACKNGGQDSEGGKSEAGKSAPDAVQWI